MDGFHQFGDAGPGKAIAGHRFETSWFWRVLPSGMRRRWWLFRLFDLIARHWPLFGERSGALIVRMDGIGDMVLFRRCLDHYADVLGLKPNQITILGCKSWDKVAAEIFAGYRLFMIDEHAFARQPFYRFKIALMVRRLAPMVTICDSYLRRAMMADSLVWVASAPTSLVSLPFINEPTRTEFTYYLSQVDRIIDTGPYPTHEVVRHSRFLSELAGREIPPLAPEIPWREKPPNIAARGAYAVLNPGSNEYGRRWPYDCYLDIAENLLARGLRVVIVGGPGERPGDYRARLGDDARINDLIGATSMPELLDILKHAACVISNDTGPAHLAIALGAPTVVVVGGGHFGSFVPYPEEARPAHARFVFEEMPCYHCFWRCHRRASRYDVFPCVSAIAVKSVWAEASALLDGND
ncbi:MAG: glycosyltransferase family 9 protein [Rhodospirillales bacterium]|jgi:ADP-heptose:LPS heptosyltransferase|nr:glycosyltransferase family 9 protein [Rhodospirillales bacterium]